MSEKKSKEKKEVEAEKPKAPQKPKGAQTEGPALKTKLVQAKNQYKANCVKALDGFKLGLNYSVKEHEGEFLVSGQAGVVGLKEGKFADHFKAVK